MLIRSSPKHATTRLICTTIAVAVVTGCDTSKLLTRSTLTPDAPSRTVVNYDDYAPGDSSPAACAFFGCESMSQVDKDDFQSLLYMAAQAASRDGNWDCYQNFTTGYSLIGGDYVFKATILRNDANGNPIYGAYNAHHGDTYVTSDRFASESEFLNTFSHEMAHANGVTDEGVAQDISNGCSKYWFQQ